MGLTFLSGLKNCHLPGLYSLVLSGRESDHYGMRRIFYASPDCRMDLWDGADFRLRPHNHRQTITLTKLFGQVENIGVKLDNKFGTVRVWRYKFGSALLEGKFALERMWPEDASLSEHSLQAGEPVRLHWSDVHTVTALPDSAWLVEEWELAPAGSERCFSTSDHLELSNEGLYVPMGPEELVAMTRRFAGVSLPAGHWAGKPSDWAAGYVPGLPSLDDRNP